MALVDLVMPKLGESIMEATILKWFKQEGDTVEQDETLLEIATDKVDSEVPSTASGMLKEILYKVNDVVPVGAAIARIETNVTETVTEKPAPAPAASITEEVEPVAESEMEIPYQPTSVSYIPSNGHRFYSPLVLNIANSEGIGLGELEYIPGTGNEGRVTKKDILQYVSERKTGEHKPVITNNNVTGDEWKQPAARFDEQRKTPANLPAETETTKLQPVVSTGKASAHEGNVEIIEMDRMRRMIAKHMVDSKHTSPHVTSFAEADVTNMVLWREKVKKDFEKREGTKVTFMPLFIEALVRVMKRYPLVNSSVDGDRIIIKKDLNIGMATALQNGNLIVPVIRNADHLNLVGLSKAVNTLADNARNNRLKPDDTQGGTFTLTNVGTFGSLMGTPIINQPQVAILAVGAIKKRPVVIETEQGDTIGIRHMMYLSLSYDHRIVDGSIGASFLTAVAKEFENWNVDRSW